jgi:hypothetical protein
MRKAQDTEDQKMFDSSIKVESDPKKWEGTGLEDDFANEYENPMQKRKKPLFEKSTKNSYMNLDGHIIKDWSTTA